MLSDGELLEDPRRVDEIIPAGVQTGRVSTAKPHFANAPREENPAFKFIIQAAVAGDQ